MGKMVFEKYPAYKYSGVEWLGEIPEHWECIRMKHLFKDHSEKNKPNAELLSVTQNQGVVPRTWVESRMVMPSGALESFKFINEGDFAISLRSFEEGLEYCYHDGIISPAYTVLKSKKLIDNKYYKYLFKSEMFISELQTSVVGIRQGKNISYPELSYSFLPIPSILEQTAIANFLDNKTALIDKAIALKEKQIDLLKERRQILIHKAVTRGLNPDVKLKDSGVEWIGEIPEGWEVKRLKHLAKNIISGPFGSSLIKDEYVKEGYKIYGQEQVIPNDFTIGDYYITESKFKRMLRYEIFKDDILISCVGTYGKIALVPEIFQKGIINPRLIKITPLCDFIIPIYLQEILLSPFCFSQFEQVSRGGTMGVINIELLSQLIIIIPTIEEQEAILSFLEKGKLKINSAISLKEKEIEKLKEYKSVLIDSVVSGKVKVS